MPAVLRAVPVMLSVFAFVAAAAVAAGADEDKSKPAELAGFRDWSAYTRTTPEGKVCYALSKPTKSLPAKVKRDPIFVLINTWPARKVKGEIQVVSGYAFKEDEAVTVSVGKLSVEFFAKNTGTSGSAWVKDSADEDKLLAAMRKGSTLTVEGTSSRGTKTTDTYSLSGIGAAVNKAEDACSK
jgi:hypothetical protein